METQPRRDNFSTPGRRTNADRAAGNHVCPWWLGYLLCCPLRRFLENPEKILAPHVREGMTVAEPGCGMGYFSLPLARLVGPKGRVLCVDLQKPMIKRLMKRARKKALDDRIEALVCTSDDLGLQHWEGRVDLVTAIHMIHEVADTQAFLRQVHAVLKPTGRLLVLEPRGHVNLEAFQTTLEYARQAGFAELARESLRGQHTAVLEKCTNRDPRPA